jgi:hypothetical protein
MIKPLVLLLLAACALAAAQVTKLELGPVSSTDAGFTLAGAISVSDHYATPFHVAPLK